MNNKMEEGEMKRFKVWERTRWVEVTAQIVRPYWTWNGEVDGYILRLKNGQEIARDLKHVKPA